MPLTDCYIGNDLTLIVIVMILTLLAQVEDQVQIVVDIQLWGTKISSDSDNRPLQLELMIKSHLSISPTTKKSGYEDYHLWHDGFVDLPWCLKIVDH